MITGRNLRRTHFSIKASVKMMTALAHNSFAQQIIIISLCISQVYIYIILGGCHDYKN